MDASDSIIFAALAEPTRLSIVDMLAKRGELAASEISKMFNSTPSAISQHLKVLRESGLAHVTKRGQQRVYSLDTDKITEAQQWLQERTSQWNARIDAMEVYIAQQNKEEKNHDK
ncbi:MAG TPA: metalloregulator ArsR/SmtB family transcription factor [Candidatus Saccharimonadales bacterium]|nr:metalloregulator ArsR/SmtB family transcription factor [Candidatus Saccharimonadales bacterium]